MEELWKNYDEKKMGWHRFWLWTEVSWFSAPVLNFWLLDGRGFLDDILVPDLSVDIVIGNSNNHWGAL